MPLAKRLKQLRARADLSREMLARTAGISASGLAKIEYGITDPAWGTVLRLARALGVSVEAFADAQPAREKKDR
jgi:DNA-binding XRE family transcriptional regulator